MSDKKHIELCMKELQDFERVIDPDMKSGKDIVEEYVQHLLKQEANADGEIYVAEVDTSIAGFIAIRLDTKNDLLIENNVVCALVSDIFVLPAYRKNGISRKLIEQAELYAKKRNISLLKLSVLANNQVARDVYQKAGFYEYEIFLLKKIV